MKKKKEWYLRDWDKTLTYFDGYLEIHDMSPCHSSYFATLIQSMTGVLTRP